MLTSGGEANVRVAGDTTIVAATLATIDEEGNDLGLLNLETNTLHYANLREFSQSSQSSFALSSNVGITGESQQSTPVNTTETSDGDNLYINSSNLAYSNTSSYSAGNSLATLGQGNITIHDQENSDALDGINRDVTNDTYALWDVERQEGNIDLTLDHRLLSETGREQIKNDFIDTREFGQDIGRAARTISEDKNAGLGSFMEVLENNTIGTQIKNELVRGPANHHILEGLQSGDPQVYAQAMNDLNALTQAKFGIPVSEVLFYNADETSSVSLADNFLSDVKGGTVLEENHAERGNIYIDASDDTGKRDQIDTLGHEIIEAETLHIGGKNDQEQESIANAFGGQLASRVDQAAGGNLDASGGDNFYQYFLTSSVVQEGTERANTVGNARVDHRFLSTERGKEALENLAAQGIVLASDREIDTQLIMGLEESSSIKSLIQALIVAEQCASYEECGRLATEFANRTFGGVPANDMGGGLLVVGKDEDPAIVREVALQFLGSDYRELIASEPGLQADFEALINNPESGIVDLREHYAMAFAWSMNLLADEAGLIPDNHPEALNEQIGAFSWNTLNLAGRWELAGRMNECKSCPQDMQDAHNRIRTTLEIGGELLILRALAASGSGLLKQGERAAKEVSKDGSSSVKWVDENASMSDRARNYDNSATGSRSNIETQMVQAPEIERTLENGTKRTVKFDGLDGDTLIDRKISVVTTPKAKDQALRQSQALSENGLKGRWEVPTEAQARRAENMFKELNIKNIEVKIVPES